MESHLPFITGSIFAGALILHARNIIQSRRERSPWCLRLEAPSIDRSHHQVTPGPWPWRRGLRPSPKDS